MKTTIDKERTPPGFKRKRESASYMSVSVRTLSEWQRRGLLPFYKPSKKIVLFKVSDLDRCLEKFRVSEIGGAK